MFELDVTIVNETGLHARPAAAFTKFCSGFVEHDIELIRGTLVINPKSILQLLSAALAKGTKLTVRVQGNDAEGVAQQIADYIAALTE